MSQKGKKRGKKQYFLITVNFNAGTKSRSNCEDTAEIAILKMERTNISFGMQRDERATDKSMY